MIPRASITAWRQVAPWQNDAQVEQDLILSRALIELYSRPEVRDGLAFRGGTALQKLFYQPASRYSEDIDLVALHPGPSGPLLHPIREALDPWLGEPRHKRSRGRVSLLYGFETTSLPVVPMRVKIEINTQENFFVLGRQEKEITCNNRWFSGSAKITTYDINELLGTKLRALYQRKKGRDLFDLWLALSRSSPKIEPQSILHCFAHYLARSKHTVSRAQFEANLAAKLSTTEFVGDITPLLRQDIGYDAAEAGELVAAKLVSQLPGSPWKGADDNL